MAWTCESLRRERAERIRSIGMHCLMRMAQGSVVTMKKRCSSAPLRRMA
jgi:hypothetical protein